MWTPNGMVVALWWGGCTRCTRGDRPFAWMGVFIDVLAHSNVFSLCVAITRCSDFSSFGHLDILVLGYEWGVLPLNSGCGYSWCGHWCAHGDFFIIRDVSYHPCSKAIHWEIRDPSPQFRTPPISLILVAFKDWKIRLMHSVAIWWDWSPTFLSVMSSCIQALVYPALL